MNCAIMPFRDHNVRLLMIDQKMPLRYGSDLEKKLSDEVKGLMQGILNFELKKRLNLPKIQQHPWVQRGGIAPPPPPKTVAETVEKTTSFTAKPNGTTPSPQAMAVLQELTTEAGS